MADVRQFLNIAHRGARAFAPENTVAAIRMAARLGANAVELDVQMSRDGELVVFHDDTLARCTDAVHKFPAHTDFSVGAFTWPELSCLDVGAWYVHELARPPRHREPFLQDLKADEVERWMTASDADEYESGAVRIPLLPDALAAARECRLGAILELKTIPRRYPHIVGRTVDAVRNAGMEGDTLVSSFDHALLAEVRTHSARLATGVLTAERLHRPRDYVLGLDADAFHPGCAGPYDVVHRGVNAEDVDVDSIREVTGAGLLVNVWTENHPERMRALIDAGVSGIITDYPNRLAAVLDGAGLSGLERPRFRRDS